MKKKPLSILFLYFFSICFIVFPAFTTNVMATSYSTGFEDGTLNTPYNNGVITSSAVSTSEFEVDNYQVDNGAKSFVIDGNGAGASGWWNLTYSGVLTGINFREYYESDGSSNIFYITMFSSIQYARGDITLNFDTSDAMITVWLHDNSGYSKYYDHNGVAQLFGSGSGGAFYDVNIQINATDEVLYEHYAYSIGGSPLNITAFNEGLTIDRIYFYIPYGDRDSIDNVNITTSSEYGGGGSGGSGQSQGYTEIGGKDYNEKVLFPINSIMETRYHQEMTADFHKLQLYVYTNDEWQAYYNLLLDTVPMYAYLNGNSLGTATFYVLDDDNDICFLEWDNFDISLSGEMPVIEYHWSSAQPIFVYFSKEGVDLDGDNIPITAIHSNQNWLDGIFNGATFPEADLSYSLYCDNLQTGEVVSPVTDYQLDIYNYVSSNHPDHDVPYYYAGETTVMIGYGLPSLDTDTYLKIYDDSGEVGQEQGYPMKLDFYTGVEGFIGFTAGWYNVSLYQNSIRILNKTFYVEENPHSYYISTYKNPSDDTNPYTVFYHYFNPSGYDGFIAVFDSTNTNEKGDSLKSYAIETNTTDNFTYSPENTGTQYWQLFVDRNNNILPVGSTHVHVCKDKLLQYGELYLSCDTVYYGVAGGKGDCQGANVISGYHHIPLSEVWIKVNDYKVKDVSNEQEFTYIYNQIVSGFYVVTLEWNLNGTWITLDTEYFNVTSFITEELPTEPSLLPDLDTKIGAIAGVIITAVFLMLPMIIAFSFKKNPTNVPAVVYAMCGGIGVILSVYMGFYGIWVPFFLLVVGIIVTALMFFNKGK